MLITLVVGSIASERCQAGQTITVPSGPDALLPFDGRWEYPHYLTFRPGNGQRCDVNPPRFSWPYVPHVLTDDKDVPLHEFCLQLSRAGNFAKPDIEIRTPYNFYNALPVLENTRWSWRVGYWAGTKQEQWSAVRTFAFRPGAVTWDRTIIRQAVQRLSVQRHPRIGPPDGDWPAWRDRLMKDNRTARWLRVALKLAEKSTKASWWQDFPKTDRRGQTQLDEHKFSQIGRGIALASFAYRLTRDARYARAKDHALALARFPRGGVASPEFHGAKRKWSTQITEFLALCYDWWQADLTAAERRVLLDAIDWRLRATYLKRASWAAGRNISLGGPAVFCASHPYENFMWSLPPVLLTAGDLKVADELVPLCLHYLTGVTSAHGPDEGWNEGLSYGSGKGRTMLSAAMVTALLLPELRIGRSPVFRRLGEWYAHLAPLGIQRLSFGDYAADPDRLRRSHGQSFRYLAWLTGDGRLAHRRDVLAGEVGDAPSGRPWIELCAAGKFPWTVPTRDEPTWAAFPEAGWVMVSTRPPSDRKAFGDAVGMIFKCRPRGGYSHSFRSENDFVWHALGQTLSASGGGMAYPDPHSRHAMSHNVVLINGAGQAWNPRRPTGPFVGRLLAHQRRGDVVYWAADATHAYQTVRGLLRCHRHVVFVDGGWFVVFDDLAMRRDAKRARFSWLFHVAPKTDLAIAADSTSFSYRLGDVHARVALANDPQAVDIVDLTGRKGFQNPITGTDLYPSTVKRLSKKGRELPKRKWMAHNLWVTNRTPAREWTVLAALLAWREGDKRPSVAFPGPSAVTVTGSDGRKRTVSFDPKMPGDVRVDVEAVRSHALATDPVVLPPTGRTETVRLGGDTYAVEWLARETFDRDDWPSRWIVEGNSEVKVADGKLCIRGLKPTMRNVATIWYRPELPANVIVRFRAQAVPPAEKNAANINLFLHAREADGAPLRFGRNGDYKEYHAIPNYIFTLTGGCRPGWSRARRDPGFNLLHHADVRSEVGKAYRVVVTVQDGRLRYYLDGVKVHDVRDPEPLSGGRFGIRTWSTNGWWDDVEIGRIKGRAASTRSSAR